MTTADPFNLRFYAGIGSRETPPEVQSLMTDLAREFHSRGFTLRSGGADGADTAFENGSARDKRIYIPWPRFNGRVDMAIICGGVQSLRVIAAAHHPAWDRCTPAAKALHTRNVAQIIGYHPEAVRSEFAVCWTKGGTGAGGTGQALRLAITYGVPVYDLGKGADPYVIARRVLCDFPAKNAGVGA